MKNIIIKGYMGFPDWFLLLLITLKFLNKIDWSWWMVILIPLGIEVIISILQGDE
jgi:hypothetical protein